MNCVRVGVIGIGNMGSAHAKHIFAGNTNGMVLAAVCDVAESARDWAKTALPGVPVYEDSTALIKSGTVDAVIIATPHYFHPTIACAAFENGLHVLSEKPAGVYTRQVEAMCKAAKASGKVFSIMFNWRTNSLLKKAHEMVHNGELGELKRLTWIITNWYRSQYYYDSGSWRASWAGEGGGVLLNQAPHNLDLWQWIFGMPCRLRATCSYGKYHNIEVEDEARIYAEYENGATADFITSTAECPGTNRLEIVGDKGKLLVEDGMLRFWRLQTREREHCFTSQHSCAYPEMVLEEMRQEETGYGHCIVLQNFADAILNGTPLIASGEEGMNELMISNAAYLSDWTGEMVELPIDPDKYYALLSKKIAASGYKDQTVKTADAVGEYSERWNIRW